MSDAATAVAIGVDLGATKTVAAVVDGLGRIRHTERWATDAGRGPEAVAADVVAHVAACRSASPVPVEAVGIGVAAQVDGRGTVRFAPNLRWREFPLGARVADAIGIPVRVLNDVRAATVGEWRHGAARRARFVVCLFIGTGLGGGAVIDGQLLCGASNAGGELGHLTVARDGRRCSCGNTGCLEAYVGGWAIAALARERLVERRDRAAGLLARAGGGPEALRAEHVTAAAAGGDPLALEILAETRDHLADGLVGMANALNPELIVAGGSVVDGSGSLFEEAFAAARHRMLPSVAEPIRCARATLGESAVPIGAASFARGEVA